jgi:hypothetical protein
MKATEVPQDKGMLGKVRVLCYVTDDKGDYVGSQSSGWEPANVANSVAWEYINEELAQTLTRVKEGELSPLAYHMQKCLMDPKVLSGYVGFSPWRVKRHLKARPFRSLDETTLGRYAAALSMTVAQLQKVPELP